jgi:hypothetical protein
MVAVAQTLVAMTQTAVATARNLVVMTPTEDPVAPKAQEERFFDAGRTSSLRHIEEHLKFLRSADFEKRKRNCMESARSERGDLCRVEVESYS